MPKAPLPKLALSSGRQARWLLTCGLVSLLPAAVLWFADEFLGSSGQNNLAIGLAVGIAPTSILMGLMWLVWSMIQRHQLRDLIQGNYWIHWVYGPGQWDEVCRDGRRANRWFLPTMMGALAGMGMLLGIVIATDPGNATGHGLRFIVLMTLGGALLGTIIGLAERHLRTITLRLRRRETGRAAVGPKGIYLTGQFFAAAALGQRVLGVAPAESTEALRLVFRVQVRGRNGYQVRKLALPVPSGQEEIAREFVSEFEDLPR